MSDTLLLSSKVLFNPAALTSLTLTAVDHSIASSGLRLSRFGRRMSNPSIALERFAKPDLASAARDQRVGAQ